MALRLAARQTLVGARFSLRTPALHARQFPQFQSSFARAFSTKYLESHEYIKLDSGVGTIGITDFAQSQLGDVVFVDLPEKGDSFEKGEAFGSVESVKAASDVYMPVGGMNDSLVENIT